MWGLLKQMNCIPPVPEEQPGCWERGGRCLGLQVWQLQMVGVELEAQQERSRHSQEQLSSCYLTLFCFPSPHCTGEETAAQGEGIG